MPTMTDPVMNVTGGVDTHKDIHVAAAVDPLGRVLGTSEFAANGAGYRQLLAWLAGYGPVQRVGVEGTGSYGAGLARSLSQAGVDVLEVIRPNRQTRRRYGKSDRTDAIAAARAVLNGEATAQPRGGHGPIESLRLLRIARRSAVRHRTAVTNQIHAVVATAPEEVRRPLAGLTINAIVAHAVRYRPTDLTNPTHAAKHTLRVMARRWTYLTDEINQLNTDLDTLVTHAAPPQLLAMCGVGTHTAADLLIAAGANPHRLGSDPSFAALCGTSPVDASSGTQQRHRLNRGGDRQANAALYRIAIVQLRYHQPTRTYMAKRTSQGRTKKETIRCIKRYLARDIWRILTNQPPT